MAKMNRREFIQFGALAPAALPCIQESDVSRPGQTLPYVATRADSFSTTDPKADAWLKDLLVFTRQHFDLPNLYGALVVRGRPYAKAALGVRRIDRPTEAKPTDRIMIGSVSKVLSATLVARYVDKGIISWNTKVADVFPTFRSTMRPEYLPVTVEMLLDHYACINRTNESAVPNEDPVAFRREISRRMLQTNPLGDTGKEPKYSSGVLIAIAMLEKLTNKTYEQMMMDDVCAPLGIGSMHFGPVDSDRGDEEPRGHTRDHSGGLVLKHHGINPYIKTDPAGGLCIRITELASFARAHFLGHSSLQRLIAPPTLAYMQCPRNASFDNQGGAGGQACPWQWANWGYNLVHGGSTGRGDATFLYIIPAVGLAIAIASTIDPQEFRNGGSPGAPVNQVLQELARVHPVGDVHLYSRDDVDRLTTSIRDRSHIGSM